MKEFDFEAAKQGAAVCTKEGHPVRIISFDSKAIMKNTPQPVVAEYWRSDGDNCVSSFGKNGSYLRSLGHPYDLMMRDDDYQERLARGEYSLDNVVDRPTVKESLIVGPSRRDLLAGMAMHGWLSSLGEGEQPIIEKGAELCVRIADTLIVELDKPSEK